MALFDALVQSDRRAVEEQKVAGPEFHYYQYQFERWSQIEEYDEPERLNATYARVAEAQQALLLIGTASSAAAGSVLQIARLCISMAWQKEHRLSKGRLIGSQPISSVIWHTRNQALHFEDGVPQNQQTTRCLELLRDEVGLDISKLEETPRSLARDVIALLGWHSYYPFATDMVTLLKES